MSQQRKLILHMDVNSTIMLADPAQGRTPADALNRELAKAASVQRNRRMWHDGTPLTEKHPAVKPALFHHGAFPEGCMEYHEARIGPSARFTEKGQHGEIYREDYEDLKSRLLWRSEPSDVFSIPFDTDDSACVHLLLPSFLNLLSTLTSSGTPFTLVFRTFGEDLPALSRAMTAFAHGQHPDYPHINEPWLAFDMETQGGQIRRQNPRDINSTIEMRLQKEGRTLAEESDILTFLEEAKHTLGFNDEYDFWKRHGFAPGAGKPLWFCRDTKTHHIFFDDNLHDKENDCIVSLRARDGATELFRNATFDELRTFRDSMLVKARITEAILDPDYFIKKVALCRSNFSRHLTKEAI